MPNMENFYYDVYNWHFHGRTAEKMESEKEKCGNCGKTSLKRGNPTTERALMQIVEDYT